MPYKEKNKSNLQTSYFFEESTISIADMFLALARNLKVILITPSILCIISIVYVLFFAEVVYTSSSTIMSSSTGGGVSQVSGLAAQFGINIPTGKSEQKWVYPEIIKSRTLAKAVLKHKFDTEKFGAQQTLLKILTDGKSEKDMSFKKLEMNGVEKLLGMIDVSEDMTTAILTLKVNASNPKLAAYINNALIEELDSHQRKYNKANTSDTKQFIEERIKNTEQELMSAEEDLKVFMDRNRRIENSPALQLEQQRLNREVIVLTGVFTTLKQQLETTKIEEVKESDYVIILDPPEIPLRRTKPNKKLVVILFGILGVGLGLFISFLSEIALNSRDEEKEKMSRAKSLAKSNLRGLMPYK